CNRKCETHLYLHDDTEDIPRYVSAVFCQINPRRRVLWQQETGYTAPDLPAAENPTARRYPPETPADTTAHNLPSAPHPRCSCSPSSYSHLERISSLFPPG